MKMVKNYFNSCAFVVLPVVLAGVIFLGCKADPECRRNTDCNVAVGEICQKGKCKQSTVMQPDTSSDTGSVAGSDSVTGEVVDTHSDSPSDITVDTTTTTPDSASDSSCVSHTDCTGANPCMSGYCNTTLVPAQCEYNPKADGVRCSADDDPCLSNGVCQAGDCVSATAACESYTSPGGCVRYEGTCAGTGDAPSCTYTEVPLADDTICYVGSPCQQGLCAGGECVETSNPCHLTAEINACTSAACQATGNDVGEFSCLLTAAPDGTICQLDASLSPCYSIPGNDLGIPGYCMESGEETSECIPQTQRACFDPNNASICAAQVCTFEDGSCIDVPYTDVSREVQCGETVTIAASEFLTREYYSYGGNCNPMDVRGKELALTVGITEATDMTFTVVEDGGQLIKLVHLTDMCDPNSCQNNASTTLSVTGMRPTDAIIIEPHIGNPPETIQISIACN